VSTSPPLDNPSFSGTIPHEYRRRRLCCYHEGSAHCDGRVILAKQIVITQRTARVPTVDEHLPCNAVPDSTRGALSDIVWSIVALVSMWVGASILIGATPITTFGILWGLFLLGVGGVLIAVVWWPTR
jgi:hypothetical protein